MGGFFTDFMEGVFNMADAFGKAFSGIAAGGFVEVRLNGIAKATWPLTAITGGIGSVGGDSTLIPLASADVISLWITSNSGAVTPVLSSTQSRMSIMLRG